MWWKNATVYQIYPASFKDSNSDGIGDIPGILAQLDYIESLGVDAIWLCPMYDSPQYDMGYDISNYEAVYPPYGTVADVEALIAGCHARGMKVLLDLVINHTSHEHAWFKESRSSRDSPKRDWYIWRPAKYDADGTRRPPNNWRGCFGGSVWEWDEETQEYYLHLFAPQQPDLNWENPETRAAIFESAIEFWLRKGIDGFRIDTVNMYSKPMDFPDAPVIDPNQEWQSASHLFCNGPRIHEYMREMGQILLKHNAMTVGELPHTPEVEDVLKYVSAKEEQLNMVFQFEIVELGTGKDLRYDTVPRNWTLPQLRARAQTTQRLMDGTTDGWSTSFLENHDQARSVSRWGSEATPELWARSAKMLAMFVASLSGTLYLYQGQEIGMVNAPASWPISEYKDVESNNYYNFVRQSTHDDPVALAKAKAALQHLARDHARLPMQWDGTAHAGFTTPEATPWMRVNDNHGSLNVKRQNLDGHSVLAFWRQMLRVRRTYPELFAGGVFQDTDPQGESLFVFEKLGAEGGKKLVVALNFTSETQPVDLAGRLGSEYKVLIQNGQETSLDELQAYEGRPLIMHRTSQACDPCKRRKVRCNGQPRCQQCTHAGIPCTYAASPAQRSRKKTVGRGKVIAECKGLLHTASPTCRGNAVLAPRTSVERTLSSTSHPNLAFFLELLPEYERYVYPMSPVVTASEIHAMILKMDSERETASFVYAFAAVTLNLTCSEPMQRVPATRERIASLLTRALEYRSPFGLESPPASIVTVMQSVFMQMCFVSLRKLDTGFLYLREAISLLYMLHVHEEESMAGLEVTERARRQRAYWECFIHERFTALTYCRPPCLPPLRCLPDHDVSIPAEVERGFNHTIENFRLVDPQFIDFWLGDRSAVTADWVAEKQRQLEDNEWHAEVSRLPLMQQADLIITRHWLRTLTWQLALSNIPLSSTTAPSMLLSLSFPLRLSNQLRQFLVTIPRDLVGIHGSGLLEKLFEIANTITDVVLHLTHAPGDETVQRIHDILFLKHFVFSFAGFANLRPVVLTQKFEMIRDKYPEIKEIELLV
ncbi:hypothetical protein ASPZODRAFT_152933 [Penicilliopsis zonata CBS 506.65]|uniref:Alpha-glucosidase n=1 Tax=Penicilliopsis zonata CBS 506.65 TaxID=1073090 RepID=A0A1L9SDT0_9EURO|nr:hypothetical protein ASPZODRAFT_152933 [Penicilliopsis zonata CBS 506.65]OJJ45237.1 hypothetical protein ASPZODRAFT_152933 [Penicilliopsis zonata CBS 506.65]